jgi:hypothetical protein
MMDVPPRSTKPTTVQGRHTPLSGGTAAFLHYKNTELAGPEGAWYTSRCAQRLKSTYTPKRRTHTQAITQESPMAAAAVAAAAAAAAGSSVE